VGVSTVRHVVQQVGHSSVVTTSRRLA
jgi:hypothetical protein